MESPNSLKVIRRNIETKLRSVHQSNTLRTVPAEIRRMIWTLALENPTIQFFEVPSESGDKTSTVFVEFPGILAAMRPDATLYWEVLEEYYATTTMQLNKKSLARFRSLSTDALVLIKKLRIEGE